MSHLIYLGFDFLMLFPALYLIFWVIVAWLVVRWMIQVIKLKKETNELLREIINKLDQKP